jgi:hypothetical protein
MWWDGWKVLQRHKDSRRSYGGGRHDSLFCIREALYARLTVQGLKLLNAYIVLSLSLSRSLALSLSRSLALTPPPPHTHTHTRMHTHARHARTHGIFHTEGIEVEYLDLTGSGAGTVLSLPTSQWHIYLALHSDNSSFAFLSTHPLHSAISSCVFSTPLKVHGATDQRKDVQADLAATQAGSRISSWPLPPSRW